MKCENCGKNEVTFVYQSNINGKRGGEAPLQRLRPRSWAMPTASLAQQRRMMRGMESLFGDSFFGGSLLGRLLRADADGPERPPMNRLLREDPFDDFFREMPALGSGLPAGDSRKAGEEGPSGEEEERSRFCPDPPAATPCAMELKKAIHQENFERAAELRDQIKRPGGQGREQGQLRWPIPQQAAPAGRKSAPETAERNPDVR